MHTELTKTISKPFKPIARRYLRVMGRRIAPKNTISTFLNLSFIHIHPRLPTLIAFSNPKWYYPSEIKIECRKTRQSTRGSELWIITTFATFDKSPVTIDVFTTWVYRQPPVKLTTPDHLTKPQPL